MVRPSRNGRRDHPRRRATLRAACAPVDPAGRCPSPRRPRPPALLEALDLVHGICERQSRRGKGRGERLRPWSRMTGWRAVHAVMAAAGLDGPQALPKGLRHGFGVAAVFVGIQLNLVQKWLGHAQITTAAIYANAVGAKEKNMVRRMWG